MVYASIFVTGTENCFYRRELTFNEGAVLTVSDSTRVRYLRLLDYFINCDNHDIYHACGLCFHLHKYNCT